MSVISPKNDVAYSPSAPLLKVFRPPIISKRNPTSHDAVPAGTVWVNTVLQTVYVSIGTSGNLTTWASYSTQTGAFHSITVDTGDIVVSLGNITATAGSISAGTVISAGTNIIAGDNISAGGIVGGSAIRVLDDVGSGVVSTVTLTNAIDDTQGVGALTMLSTNGNPGTNAGFLKVYIGTAACYIPYFDDIAP